MPQIGVYIARIVSAKCSSEIIALEQKRTNNQIRFKMKGFSFFLTASMLAIPLLTAAKGIKIKVKPPKSKASKAKDREDKGGSSEGEYKTRFPS